MAKGENSSISLEENSSSELRPWQSYHTVYTNAKAGFDLLCFAIRVVNP